MRATDNLCIYL